MPRLVLACVLLLAIACPRRFDPAAQPSIPTSGKPEARSRFDVARARFERAEYQNLGEEFEALVREYPDDPIAPFAQLYAGMTAHRSGDPAAAAAILEKVAADTAAPEEVRRRARFYLGLSEAAVGNHAEARGLLEPFAGQVGQGEEEVELHAALAEATAGGGDIPASLPHYDRFFAAGRPAERAHVAARVEELVGRLDPAAAAAAYERAGKDGPSAAYLGRRLAAEAQAAGQPDRARALLAETAGARAAVGLPAVEDTPAGAGDPQVLGAALPLSGKRRLVGEAAARGLTLAAGTYDRAAGGGVAIDGVPLAFEVALEDAGEGKARAAEAVDALAAAGAIAVVGPVDRDAADEAAGRAAALGLPLITLDVAESASGAAAPTVFRAVISVEARARALAAHALAKGVKRFAVLAPEIAYGTRAAAAFRAEVEARGGQIVAEVRYPKETTSFVDPVAKLAKAEFDGLFVPDTGARLELIAPQLAVADLVVQPTGERRPRRGRPIALFSTAEALGPKFLRGSGRYTKGAVLAPGFFPDEADPRIGAYVARYRLAYGEDPTYLDAYAYDAALVVRAAVEAGARDRASLGAALAAGKTPGLTGDIAFDAARSRADRGVLFVVTADGATIRALR